MKKNYQKELETLTLNALTARFSRAGIEHPTLEAKKYLKNTCFYGVKH